MRIAILACLLLCALTGCEEDYPHPTGTGLPQDTDSAAMHGIYEGTGLFSCPGSGVTAVPVTITVRVTDIGEDYVRISLAMRPDLATYIPHLSLEGLVRARTCQFHQYDDQFKHWVNLLRSQDVLSGTVGVTDLAGHDYWYVNQVLANRQVR
jgi:hypothetical protein